MTFGAETWGPPLLAAGASFLGGQGNAASETKMQKTQRKLIDKLLSSLSGDGEFSGLYDSSDDAFQKSFVEPAQARFRNQTAPQIQQQFIESGQQRGSGLDDSLLRAGVDMDSLLNQYAYQFENDAKNRQQNTMANILGQGAGAPNQPSMGQNVMSGLSGYLAAPETSKQFAGYFKDKTTAPAATNAPPRRGFAPDWSDFKLGDTRWGQS